MATSSYVGSDVSKDRLDVAVLGDERVWQVANTQKGINELVAWTQELEPELIVVETMGGYQRAVVEVVNPAREVPPKKWRQRKDKVHLNRRQSDERAQGEAAIHA